MHGILSRLKNVGLIVLGKLATAYLTSISAILNVL